MAPCARWFVGLLTVPSCPCRALVFVSHGAGEHCGRYEELAQMLVGLHLLVFAHDHGECPGCGTSWYLADCMSVLPDSPHIHARTAVTFLHCTTTHRCFQREHVWLLGSTAGEMLLDILMGRAYPKLGNACPCVQAYRLLRWVLVFTQGASNDVDSWFKLQSNHKGAARPFKLGEQQESQQAILVTSKHQHTQIYKHAHTNEHMYIHAHSSLCQ